MPHLSRRTALLAGVGGLAAAARPADHTHSFHTDHVLGTSFDLHVTAPDAGTAARAETTALAEIERMRRVFSLYDPDSELSRLNRTAGPVPASADLITVLRQYERWAAATSGACNPLVGSVAQAWATAAPTGVAPAAATLAQLARDIARTGWAVDDRAGTVARLTPHPLDLNAAAKGYILDRVAAVLRPLVPAALIDLGGDLIAFGDRTWAVGVQNPHAPADNAAPIGAIVLRAGSVATSGSYQRFTEVGGVRRSHLLDPRTGQPADGVAAATVTAADSRTANLLATAVCVLGPTAGLRLLAGLPGTEGLIVGADRRRHLSPGFVWQPLTADDPPTGGWPAGYQLTVDLELPAAGGGRRYRRPYVAVWFEDATGKPVRTLTVWGNSPKWLKDLSDWWKVGKDRPELVKAVTRATRGPGKYTVEWDGKDDAGNPVPAGTYTVRVEVHREHGQHLRQTDKLAVGGTDPTSVTMKANAETGETVVRYGKKPTP